MNHKRKRPKQRRAGCLVCKPDKLSDNKTADRMKARREWRRLEGVDRLAARLSPLDAVQRPEDL